MKLKKIMPVWVAALFAFGGTAFANIAEVKVYKEAFPGEKPKCIGCHTSDKPKKDDGQHDLNDYGKKVVALKEKPDAATYKEAGQIPS